MNFSFVNPIYLVFLFAIPLVFFVHFYSLSNKKKIALNFANFDAISRIKGIDFFSKNVISLVSITLIISLLAFSASGLTIHTTKDTSSFSIIIAIDSSQSMEAVDFSPNRLEAAKEKSIEFIDNIPFGSNFGVLSFAGNTKIESELTNDRKKIKDAINGIEISKFGGTDFFELAITASNLLWEEESKAIIILSDGQINIGDIQEIIDYSIQHDIIVHTIGMGTREGGNANYYISKIDEDVLKSISHNTGGKYFSAEDEEELLNSYMDILDLTEKKVSINLSLYLLVFAFVLILIEYFLKTTRYSNIL